MTDRSTGPFLSCRHESEIDVTAQLDWCCFLARLKLPLVDINREKLVAILEDRSISHLAKAAYHVPGRVIQIQGGIIAKQEAWDHRCHQAYDHQDDQQLQKRKAVFVADATSF